ncbi:MAG: hypothetical protein WBO77_03075 [Microgenomates group bacterium]
MNPNFTSIDFLLNQPAPAQPPISPISTGSVEKTEPAGGRIIESKPIAEIQEAAKNEQPQQPNVHDYVQINSSVPTIPADVAAAGVQVAPSVVSANEPLLELPLPDEQIPAALKKPVSSGLRWIAEICLYMLRKAHLKIKTIHGKVMRVADK